MVYRFETATGALLVQPSLGSMLEVIQEICAERLAKDMANRIIDEFGNEWQLRAEVVIHMKRVDKSLSLDEEMHNNRHISPDE